MNFTVQYRATSGYFCDIKADTFAQATTMLEGIQLGCSHLLELEQVEHTDTQLQHLAETLWNREHPLNETMLVSDLLSFDPFNSFCFRWDDVDNLYPDPSNWSLEECIEYLCIEHDITDPVHATSLADWKESVVDHASPAEPLEWWAVSEWFATKLKDKGECILDNDYGIWWGRTCSGQAVSMDGVIQDIAVATLPVTYGDSNTQGNTQA